MSNRISVERDGTVLMIGFDRAEKYNAADLQLLEELALAYGELERDPDLRCGVVFAHGEHFTAGLDLADIAPRIGPNGLSLVPPGGIDPWQVSGPARTKPVVTAVNGTCLTLGIELVLANDIAVAANNTRFAQLEVTRAILPFGGATIRFPAAVGWGNAMRWILTGDYFDAAEAFRIGLVQKVVSEGEQVEAALEIAHRIAAQAPLAVQASLANARLAARNGPDAAEQQLQAELVRLLASNDAKRGMTAFLNRSTPEFLGD